MRIVVVGGGIAGLAAALRVRELAGDSAEILVVEGSRKIGGKVRTATIAGELVETGAENFLVPDRGAKSAAVTLAHRVGLGADLTHPAPLPAAIAINGVLHPIPAGTILGVPADPSTLDGVARVADRDEDTGRPLLASGEDVAVGALVRRRMGDEVVDLLVDPMLGGVYAGRADILSLAATMPALYTAAQDHTTLAGAVRAALAESPRPPGTTVFATVRGGLGRLVEATAAASSAEVRLGAPVRELTRTPAGWRLVVGATRDPADLEAEGVVLAVPGAAAARLLQGVDADAASLVGELDYASVALVTLALPADVELPALSGLLVPERAGCSVKAVTFISPKWPQLRRPGAPVLVRASLGRYGDGRVLRRLDDELIALVRADLEVLLRTTLPEPIEARVTRWGGGLPQYAVGHLDRVARARSALPTTLGLAGAAFDGVGIAACVRSGQAAAEAVLAGLRQSQT